MQDLFSEPGTRQLDRLVQPGLLCVFDFDGTLSPLVANPERAWLPQNILERLMRLQALTPVAVLTGRSVADVNARLGFVPDHVIGNHGIEGLDGWETRAAHYEALCHDWKVQLCTELAKEGWDSGHVFVEDKRYSLSVHYRHVEDPDQVRLRLEEIFATLQPQVRVVAGKFVFNLVPPDAMDKGRAMTQLMRDSAAPAALYVGDDVTDEDAFRLQAPNLLSIRIEASQDSAATFFLPCRRDIGRLLDMLIARLQDQQPGSHARTTPEKTPRTSTATGNTTASRTRSDQRDCSQKAGRWSLDTLLPAGLLLKNLD